MLSFTDKAYDKINYKAYDKANDRNGMSEMRVNNAFNSE